MTVDSGLTMRYVQFTIFLCEFCTVFCLVVDSCGILYKSPGHGAVFLVNSITHTKTGSLQYNLINSGSTTNYPTTAAEILDLLKEKMAILSGGRDRQGQSIITFPAMEKTFVYDRGDVRKVVQYLTSIPT